jgi:HD-like signal output (HDOD) protein
MSALPISSDNDSLKRLISKVNDLAVLPHVVFKVLEISTSTDSPAQDMERAIIVDPGFSGKLLTLANSAQYALPKKVTSIKEAIMFLGYRQIRSMAMTVGVFELFVGKTDKESLRRRTWWRHSVDAAVCCRWLATSTKKLSPDDAYTSGLLHYMGKSLLDKYGDRSYDEVEFNLGRGLSDIEAEERVFGCNHVEVTMAAAEKWGFPEELRTGLYYLSGDDAEGTILAARACTALGSQIAHVLRDGHNEDCAQHALPAWTFAPLGLNPDDATRLLEGASSVMAQTQMSF